jgi:hypothetical protein
MARQRTQKQISRRIDLNYFKRMHPLRTGRKAAIWLCFVAAILFVTFYSIGGAGRLHNPGHMTKAHAMWENDCAACHAGNGHGGFSQAVSDNACLKCHDAAIHNSNQTKFISMGTGPGATAHATSANCMACHTEHRGQAALLGTNNDSSCVVCHAEIEKNSKITPVVKTSVTGFSESQHPKFGRELLREGKWFDPTVLKFNHKRHNSVQGLENNCVACHSASDPSPDAKSPGGDSLPPWKTKKDRPAEWANSANLRNMQPISYERNCIGCHALNLPGNGPAVAHDKMEVVRAQLLSLPAMYAEMFAKDPEHEKKLKYEIKEGRPPRQKTIVKTYTEAEYLEAQLKSLGDAVDKGSGSDKNYAAVKKAVVSPTTLPSFVGTVQGPNENLVEFYVANNTCVKCHELTGQVPALALGGKATTQPALLATVPTGIPDAPRRWFASSEFDHYAHRDQSCLDCHAAAVNSEKTSDVLSPDIDTRVKYTLNGKEMTGKACIDCHRTGGTEMMAADSHCVACHVFHDRTKERAPGPIDVAKEMAAPGKADAAKTAASAG